MFLILYFWFPNIKMEIQINNVLINLIKVNDSPKKTYPHINPAGITKYELRLTNIAPTLLKS